MRDETDLWALYARLLASDDVQVWLKDLDYRFVAVNGRFAAAVGCREKDLVGHTDNEIFDHWHVHQFRCDDRSTLARGAAMMFEERDEGGRRYATLKIPLPGYGSGYLGTVGMAVEIDAGGAAAILPLAAAAAPPPERRGSRSDPAGRGSPPRWLEEIKALLVQRRGAPLAVHRLAAAFSVSPDYLGRSFRRHYGVLISDYLRGLRVARAIELLETSRRSLADIALEAGFSDQSHFTRTFKRVLGITPAEYRRHLRP